MKTPLKAKRIFIYLLLSFALICIVGAGLIYYYKHEIINTFVAEANKYLKTEIKVKSIDLSIKNFPMLAIHLKNVEVGAGEHRLALAENLYLSFDAFEIFSQQYRIREVELHNGKISMLDFNQDSNNYQIFENTGNKESSGRFTLETIRLSNIDFSYSGYDTKLNFRTSEAFCSLVRQDDIYDIHLNGDIYLNEIRHHSNVYISDTQIALETSIVYHQSSKTYTATDTDLAIDESQFKINGNYSVAEKSMRVNLHTDQASLKTLGTLMPNTSGEHIKKYKADGFAQLDISISKTSSESAMAIESSFGFKNLTLIEPESNLRISNSSLTGELEIRDIGDLSGGKLKIRDARGQIQGRLFNGNLDIINFKNPLYHLDFSGSFSASEFAKIARMKKMDDADGVINFDINYSGRKSDLQNKHLSKVKTAGQLSFDDVSFTTKENGYQIKKMNGSLLFNDQHVAINSLSGFINDSDFLVNGFMKNLLPFLLLEDQPLGIEAKLKSKHLILDNLLTNGDGPNELAIPPYLRLNLKCDIAQLSFDKLQLHNLQGQALLKNQLFNIQELTFESFQGRIKVNGALDQASGINRISTIIEVDDILINELFAGFHDFNQSFISSENLKGFISGMADVRLNLDKNLNLISKTLNSDLNLDVHSGELINFKPLMNLKKYVKDEDLSHLYFKDISTSVLIANEKVYLTEINVGTNITNIQVSGIHGFDHNIDYRVVVPLNIRKKNDSDEIFGAIEETHSGKSLLHLKIIGNTSDYEIKYDKDRVKSKIARDISLELKELKEAIKNKGAENKKKVELSEDDYFDW